MSWYDGSFACAVGVPQPAGCQTRAAYAALPASRIIRVLLPMRATGYNWWRFDVVLQLGSEPAVLEYAVVCSTDHIWSPITRYPIHLPSAGQKCESGRTAIGLGDAVLSAQGAGASRVRLARLRLPRLGFLERLDLPVRAPASASFAAGHWAFYS